MTGFIAILLCTVTCGVLAGLRNFTVEFSQSKSRCPLFWRCMLEAIAACAIVPLFLSIIGNDVISSLLGTDSSPAIWYFALLKLAGFCLITGLYSRRFLDVMSNKIINMQAQIDETKKQTEDATKKLEQTAETVALLNDAVVESDITPMSLDTTQAQAAIATNSNERAVLEALARGNVPVRSTHGLAMSTKLPVDEVERALKELEKQGLAAQRATERGERWIPTSFGRELVADG